MKASGIYKAVAVTASLIVLFITSATAVQFTPEARLKLKEAGKLDSFTDLLKNAKINGMDIPAALKTGAGVAFSGGDFDTLHVLVLLVDFSDHPYTGGSAAADTAIFDSILFSTGRVNPTGSMTEYYLENSYGKFLIRGEVHGWYRMPHLYSYYVMGEGGIGDNYPNNSRGLAEDAIQVADEDGLNFATFDTYGGFLGPDWEIDGLLIVHAGPGMEQTGNENHMLSHKWNLVSPVIIDGITIIDYTIQPEEYGSGVSPIGTFCHEFAHVLGMPDLYDIDYDPETSNGIGIWSLMATGNYKGNSRLPSHLDAWCKMALGFVDPTEVYSNMTGVEFPQVESEPVIYRLWKDGQYGSQYFLVENRQATGFDSLLPGSGLLIYHVDDAASHNNINVNHYHVAVEQADGLFQLEYALDNDGDPGDPWPGPEGKTSFDDLSIPDSRDYGDFITEVSVWNISPSGPLMTANLDIEWSRPYLELALYDFSDANGNGDLEPSETVEFYFDIRNYWLTASDAVITMTSNDPDIQFIDPSVYKDFMPGDGAFTGNIGDPIVFVLPDTLIPTYDSFFVTVESDGGVFSDTFGIEQQVGTAQILILDDDRGASYDTLYVDDLYRKLIPVDIWNKAVSGVPPAVILNKYHMVFWFTGDTCPDYFQTADIDAMKSFLDNGGNLFLTGQGLAGELHAQDSAFLENYLHTRFVTRPFFAPGLEGISASPIGDGLVVRFFSMSNFNYEWGEKILPVGDAIPAFQYRYLAEGYNSLSYSGNGYRLVFFDFNYEALDSVQTSRWDSRHTVLGNILNFFGNIETEVGSEEDFITPASFELKQNYPNPFNPGTTIRYTVRHAGVPVPNTVIEVFNILGQKIKLLVDEKQIPGSYSVLWDGTNEEGRRVSTGVYFYRIMRGDDSETKKMVLLK